MSSLFKKKDEYLRIDTPPEKIEEGTSPVAKISIKKSSIDSICIDKILDGWKVSILYNRATYSTVFVNLIEAVNFYNKISK